MSSHSRSQTPIDNSLSVQDPHLLDQSQDPRQQLSSQLKSPHFFSMSGIPKFGKNWLDNFIPDEEMQNVFLTSEVVRNVIMLQCVYYVSVYSDLVKHKQMFGATMQNKSIMESEKMQQVSVIGEQGSFKVGIIGCGQLGTMILTKLIET